MKPFQFFGALLPGYVEEIFLKRRINQAGGEIINTSCSKELIAFEVGMKCRNGRSRWMLLIDKRPSAGHFLAP